LAAECHATSAPTPKVYDAVKTRVAADDDILRRVRGCDLVPKISGKLEVQIILRAFACPDVLDRGSTGEDLQVQIKTNGTGVHAMKYDDAIAFTKSIDSLKPNGSHILIVNEKNAH
jgi:hypothetical protein